MPGMVIGLRYLLSAALILTVSLLRGGLSQRHGDLRLTGYGSNALSGQLEVYHNGSWGGVCGGVKFNMLTGSVACRQLGLGPAIDVVYYPDLRFGLSEVTNVMSDVICSGSESHLLQCQYSMTGCLPYQIVGIICSRFVLPYSGAVRLYSTPSPASTAISPSNGFLELFLYGEWRLVCGGTGFDQSAAITTCRQLGYTSGFYNESSMLSASKTWKLATSCTNNDTCLSSCGNVTNLMNNEESCSHTVNLTCVFSSNLANTPSGNQSICERVTPYHGAVKVESNTIPDGLRVEGFPQVYLNGSWYSVCNHDKFRLTDADVLCKQLSYTYAQYFDETSRSLSTGTMLSCSGLEYSVLDCPVLHTTQCSETIRIKCYKGDPMYGSLRLLNAAGSYGSLHVFNGILFHPVCDSGFGWNELIVACRQLGYNRALQIVNNSLYGVVHENASLPYSFSCTGKEKHLMGCQRRKGGTCRYPYDTVAIQCSTYNLHTPSLVGGNTTSGRLTLSVNGQMGTVCGLNFNDFAAHVACREMGFETFSGFTLSKNNGPFSIDPIVLTSVHCTGFESDLLSCRHSVADNGTCNHQHDVHLYCSTEKPYPDGQLRIVPTKQNEEMISGRLDISFHGLWMSVCGKFFSEAAANVACRQMNYTTAVSYCTINCEKTGTGHIYFAETQCTGNELKLIECEHEIHNNEFCGHQNDVTITCIKDVVTETTTTTPSPSVTATVEPTQGETSPSPSSFFLPIPRLMFYFIVAALILVLLICLLCALVCCCMCCRRKKSTWETRTNGSLRSSGITHNEQYNIYDYPHFNEAEEGKDSSFSWGNGKEKGELELGDPPHYDELKFQSSLGENHYQIDDGLYTSSGVAVGSHEMILDTGITHSLDV